MVKIKKNRELIIEKVEFIKSCSDREAKERLDLIFDMLLGDSSIQKEKPQSNPVKGSKR